MKLKAAIFDLDGTLLNTLDDIADSCNMVLAGAGFNVFPTDAYKEFVGMGLKHLVTKALPEHLADNTLVDLLTEKMKQEYRLHLTDKTQPYPEIGRMLSGLTEKKIPFSVLSNKPHILTEELIRILLGEYSFSVVMGGSDRFPRKPDPVSALFVAERMGHSPAETAFIGDSDIDMQTAVNAGMYPIGVTWGFRTREELVHAGAKGLAGNPEDVIGFFNIFG